MNSNDAINSLISPLTTDEFFRTHWEKKFLHLKRDSPNHYESILKIEDIDRYLQSETLHPSFLRVVKSGKDSHPKGWTRIERRRNTEFYRVVDVPDLFLLFSEGATLIVNSAEKAIPTLTPFCNALEQELKTRVQANLYVTPPNEEGFQVHHDLYDVFVLQISGKKNWRLFGIAEDPEKNKTGYSDGSTMAPEHEFDMQPGDLLYIPKHRVHAARAANEPSIHITIGIHTRRWFHLLQEMAAMAEKSPDFQATLPGPFATDQEKASFSHDFSEKMKSLMDTHGANALLDNERNIIVRDQLFDQSGRFSDLLRVGKITLDSILRKRQGIDVIIEKTDKSLVVKFGRKEFSYALVLGPALNSLLRDEPFVVRGIAGLIPDSGKLKLASDLVRAGLLTICSI